MRIVCIGAGYVGTVTAAAFAALGHETILVDVDERKLQAIQQGRSPIYEPGLDQLLEYVVTRHLTATASMEGVAEADAVFICVGTPENADHSVNLSYIKQAAIQIGNHLNPRRFTVIVTKSTVPVGSADLVSSLIEAHSRTKSGSCFTVVSNPEFLREGSALTDVFFPDRIVIGSAHPRGSTVMKQLYRNFMKRTFDPLVMDMIKGKEYRLKPKPVYLETDPKSAELIKYASNAFLAVKISYINEIARLCEALGSNVSEVAKGMGLDHRIGSQFLEVSSGWGGSCFPKDTAELLATSTKYDRELTIVRAAVEANQRMMEHVVSKLKQRMKTLQGKTIAVLGLTFKPNTDDIRNSQAIVIIRMLEELGAFVQAHDPKGMPGFRKLHPELSVRYCEHAEEAAAHADALLLLTHWEEYRTLPWERIRASMRRPYILDTRRLWSGVGLPRLGFRYETLGADHDAG
ncbi:UDP-glucose dehydrogenase family protein [Paenibacillus sp. y28]|uniref:UDP-glucose dehydrogenase family protein n=1 Tax=Paenibacillus sp. y28 TaxID=3129110 RepID=UPI00301B0183